MTTEITPTEDRVHYPWPGSDWIESYWFGFYDPAQQVGLVSLIGFNPGESRSRLWLHVFEVNTTTVRVTELQLPLAAPDENAVTVGGYRVEFVDDLNEFAITYSADRIALDVRWIGASKVKATTGGRPFPGQKDLDPHGHSEQAGVVSGCIRVDNRPYELTSAPAWRDHLWGHAITDGWTEMGWWCWLVGTTEDGSLSFNVTSHRFPSGRTGNYGFMFVGDQIRRICVTECEVETDESRRHPVACQIAWTDRDDGTKYVARGNALGKLFMEEPVAGGVCVINDPPTEFVVNGAKAYGTLEMGDVFRF